MKTFDFVIQDANGIHARPAGMLVKAASGFLSDIQIKKGEKTANAKRLFGVMGLAVKQGEQITVVVTGTDEEMAAEELESFFKANL